MRHGLTLVLLVSACAERVQRPERAPVLSQSTMAERCASAPRAIADRIGQELERRLQTAQSSEEAGLALLELTPNQPLGQTLLSQALAQEGLSRGEFEACLRDDEQAFPTFRRRLEERVEDVRVRAQVLPQLSATEQGCRRLLPMTVSAKEEWGLPIALAARMVLPCAGRVSERELRCAIAEGKLAHFVACCDGERDPPDASVH